MHNVRAVQIVGLFPALLLLGLGDPDPLSSQTPHPEIHSPHFLYGYPVGAPPTNDLIIRPIYALSSNDSTKFADWVAYRIDPSTVTGPSVDRDWDPDPWLTEDETLEPDDYDDAHAQLGTDRGHQAPLAAFRGTGLAQQTNYLSNITPQRSPLNQGPWRELEDAVRTLAEDDSVYVLTGPLYEDDMPSLPQADEGHRVPSGYWKVVATKNDSAMDWAAFIMNQNLQRRADYCDQRVSINDVEARARLNFFHLLPKPSEDVLESSSHGNVLSLGCG